jgi:hypothetical protein
LTRASIYFRAKKKNQLNNDLKLLTLKCNNFGHLQEKVNDAITKINSQGDSSQFIKNL